MYVIPAIKLWKFCEWHMDDRKLSLCQVCEFQAATAECFKAEDRPSVEGKIKPWFGSLDSFDNCVCTDIEKLVSKKLDDRIHFGSRPTPPGVADLAICSIPGGSNGPRLRDFSEEPSTQKG